MPVFAAAITLSLTALAGTPETKHPSANKTQQDDQHTYFVISEQTIGGQVYYNVTTSNPGCPDVGSKPCEVLSDQLADSNNRIPQSAVLSVESTRN
ncbi:hypothetical protein [Pedobacter steynii]|uniref:hypothetical protein n=1 Tax=Pedobacter steynii TaxID=430522 RepID=UPI0012F78590|nr:hypothetical protein [Pedobacter steynii]